MSFECWILLSFGQYVFESRKDSIGVVSFELWYACVLRVIRVAQTAD